MTNNPATGSFSVQGRVFDLATKRGLGNLLVTIYDVDEAAGSVTYPSLASLMEVSTPIANARCDEGGGFVVRYGKDDLLALGTEKKRLDLLVVISAPDDEKSAAAEKVVYFSNPPRRNAGRIENFNIGITPETQRKFGLDGEINIQDTIGSYQRLRTDENELNHGIVDFHRASIEQDVVEKAVLRQELLKRIATNVDAVATTGELVRDNESIKEKVGAVGAKAVARANSEINESRGVPVTLYFTPADRDRLRPFFEQATDGFAVIPEHELQDILFRTNSSENPGTLLVHQNPIAKFCAEQTFEEGCAKIHTGLEGEDGAAHDHGAGDPDCGPPGPVAGSGIEILTNADIPRFVAKLVGSAPSPDSVLTPEFNEQRADQKAVEDSVDAFSLRKGPAEDPAIYDRKSAADRLRARLENLARRRDRQHDAHAREEIQVEDRHQPGGPLSARLASSPREYGHLRICPAGGPGRYRCAVRHQPGRVDRPEQRAPEQAPGDRHRDRDGLRSCEGERQPGP